AVVAPGVRSLGPAAPGARGVGLRRPHRLVSRRGACVVTVRTKLLLAQLPLALSLLVVGAVSRRTIGELGHNAEDILKDNYLSVLAAQRVRDAADTMADVALMHARGHQSPVSVDVVTRQRQTLTHELAFQEHNITEVGEREMTARLRGSWARFADE